MKISKSLAAIKKELRGLDQIEDASHEVTRKSHVIAVMDREADFYELFAKQRAHKRTDILVRAQPNRKLHQEQQDKLFASLMSQEPEAGEVSITIDAQSMRKKISKAPGNPGRKKRIAHCEIRFRELCLKPTLKGKGQEKLVLWGVSIEEKDPEEGAEPVSWKLLTSIKVKDKETALQMLEYYQQRWKMEDFFRVLKSGCKIEKTAFRTRERIERMTAIMSVVAWRMMLMYLLGREVPDSDPKIRVRDDELSFLKRTIFTRTKKSSHP